MTDELKPYDYQQETHSNYEVWLRDMRTGNRRSIILWASSFGDAESQAMDGSLTRKWFDVGNEEIVKIDKEYDATSTDA